MVSIGDNPGSPSWSADGRYLAYQTSRPGLAGARNFAIVIRDRSTGGIVRELHPALDAFALQEWDPGGKVLIASGTNFDGRYGNYAIDATTGDVTSIPGAPDVEGCLAPRMIPSPDGKMRYFQRPPCSGGGLLTQDVATGSERELLPGTEPSNNTGALSPDGRFIFTSRGLYPSRTNFLVPTEKGESPRQFNNGVFLTWAPDSGSVILSTGGLRPEVMRVALDGRSQKIDWNLPQSTRSTNNAGEIASIVREQQSGQPDTAFAIDAILRVVDQIFADKSEAPR